MIRVLNLYINLSLISPCFLQSAALPSGLSALILFSHGWKQILTYFHSFSHFHSKNGCCWHYRTQNRAHSAYTHHSESQARLSWSWRHHGRSTDFGSLRVWSGIGRAHFKQTLNVDLNSSDALTVLEMLHRAHISTMISCYIMFFFPSFLF